MTTKSTRPDLNLTYGIEEEFFLIDPHTRNLTTRPPSGFFRACRLALGERVGEELLQPQVEITTPVLSTTAQARQSISELRSRLDSIASRHELGLVASGSHPFATWDNQRRTDKPRYEELIDDFQIVGRRNLFCGLHVHVGVPEGHDRVILMNRLIRWIPMLLALSTSSPFWMGRPTGLLSYRQAAYDEWPRSGIPDAVADEREYASFVRLLASCGALRDGSYLWWAIRPSARFPTLELRIADACTHVDDSLALAAAFRCLVRAHIRRPELGSSQSSISRRVVDENRWRAKRYGTDAEFIDESLGSAIGFHSTLAEFARLVEQDASELDCQREIRHLWTILERGTSAHGQLATYRSSLYPRRDEKGALVATVDWLAQATSCAEGEPLPTPAPALDRHVGGGAAIA